MPNYGLNTYDNSGRQMASTVLSPYSVGFHAGDYTTTNSKVPTAADGSGFDSFQNSWARAASIVNSTEKPFLSIHDSSSAYHEHSQKIVHTYGGTVGNSFQYVQPTAQIISEGMLLASTSLSQADFVITKQEVNVRAIGFRNKKTANNYGAYVLNQNYNNANSALIDEKYTQMYVQPSAATGALVQFANAAIYPRVPGGSYTWAPASHTTFGRDIPGNVIFPRPYDKPPLIFIQNSSDYISLYSMNKNEDGKYVSATIVGYYEVRNTALASDDYAWPKQSPFSYFLVSEDEPSYALKPTDNVGMQVFDSTGAKLFDSRYQSVPLNVFRYYKSAAGFRPANNLSGGQNLLNPVYNEAIVPKGQAFCINNLIAFDGLCTVATFVNTVQPFYKTGYGLVYGRFIKIEELAAETKVTISTQCTGCSSGFLNGSLYHVAFGQTNTMSEILSTRLETEKYTSPIKTFASEQAPAKINPKLTKFKNPIVEFSFGSATGLIESEINQALFKEPIKSFSSNRLETAKASTSVWSRTKDFVGNSIDIISPQANMSLGNVALRNFRSDLNGISHETIYTGDFIDIVIQNPVREFSSTPLLFGLDILVNPYLANGYELQEGDGT